MPRDGHAAARAELVEGPWELPGGWRWRRLCDIAEVNPRTDFSTLPNDAETTFLPMAAVAEESGRIDVSAVRKIQDVAKGFTRFRTGDVLFAKITPCMENGKVAVVPQLTGGVGAGSTEFHVIRPHSISSALLFHFLVQRSFRQEARRKMSGSAGQLRVPVDYLREHPIPVPPPEVQAKLSARIDSLFAEIDDGERALADARAGVETYRKSLLKAAVTGELTADWRRANPQAETGHDLLRRILADRRARWSADPKNRGKRYVEPVGPETDRLPELPEGWCWTALDQISRSDPRNGLSIKEASAPTEVQALRLSALASEFVDWTQTRYLPRTWNEVATYSLDEGDLLVSRANGSPELVGKASICQEPPNNVIFPDTAIRYRLGANAALNYWVVTVWNSDFVRTQLSRRTKTTAGILKVSQGDVRSVAVPLSGAAELREHRTVLQNALGEARGAALRV